jgi:hypothetical protein
MEEMNQLIRSGKTDLLTENLVVYVGLAVRKIRPDGAVG